MRQILIFLFAVFLVMDAAWAQRSPMLFEYDYNPYIINPAYAGFTPALEVSVAHSGFMNDFEGSPFTTSLTGNLPMERSPVGLGVGFMSDNIGVEKTRTLFGSYAYQLRLEDNVPYWKVYNPSVIAFGISAGVANYRENLTDLGLPTDPMFSEDMSETIPYVSLGAMFNRGPIFVGISASNVLNGLVKTDRRLKIETPIYGYFGYRFYTDYLQTTLLKPSILLKYVDGAPMQVDANLVSKFGKYFEVGGGYRSDSTINLMAGVYLFERLRAVYSFQWANGDSPLGNSQGIVLNYRFGNGFNE